jgi:hypothetical protein
VKSLSAIMVSLLVYASAAAAVPLGAATDASPWSCDASSGAIAGRGGDAREPDLGEVHEDLPAAAKGKAAKRFSATVPVYLHVVTDGRSER